jgi:hypothetical protein
LDNFEVSVKKLETTRMQWRAKYAIKDGELEAAKVSLYTRRRTHLSEKRLD